MRASDLMQVNVTWRSGPYGYRIKAKPEVIMLEFYEPGAAIIEDSVAKTVERTNKTSKRVLDFMFGAQNVMLEEAIFVSNEIVDRVRTETQLFNEFVSKVAGAHSVTDLKTLREECSQHQIDFIRRDSERIFKHGERMIEAVASLFNNPTQI
jgi:hypothetical protein